MQNVIDRRASEAEPADSLPLRGRLPATFARDQRVSIAALLLGVLASVGIFATIPPAVNIRAITDIGLISVLPWTTFLALGLLTLCYWLTLLYYPRRTWLLVVHVVVLIVMLYGITTFLEGTPRFGATWKHIGLTEYFIRGRPIDPSIDAYFSWPAFFILNAFLASVAGLQTPLHLVVWAPVVYNLIYLGPLLLIFRAFTRDARLVWLSAWLFYVTNWIGQDYFSPQGLNYFSYLVILAILLTWFRRARPVPGEAVSGSGGLWPVWVRRMWAESHIVAMPLSPRLRAGLVAIVVLIDAAVVASHQLTPIALLVAVAGLVVLGRSHVWRLPVLMAILLVAWLGYMAQVFLEGHLSLLTSGIGHLTSSVGSNVGSRVQGSPGHLFIIHVRLLMTVAIWGIAVLGIARRIKHGIWDTSCVLLAGAPFILLGLQSYGGEMALRIYLFSLPFMVFLAAALFLPRMNLRGRWNLPLSLGAASVMSLALTMGFLFARYGNERMDYFTPAEITAIQQLYQIAPHGSTFWTIGVPPNEPWREAHYEQYQYTSINFAQPTSPGTAATSPSITVDGANETKTVGNLARIMKPGGGSRSYLVLTRSQILATHLLQGVSPQVFYSLERTLDSSHRFIRVISNRDARIYLLRPQRMVAG